MLSVVLQLLILGVDAVLGSDGTIHTKDLAWSSTLTPSLCLNYLALAICNAYTVVYQVAMADFRTDVG